MTNVGSFVRQMSKPPWGKIGAWAAESERADAEEREAAEKAAAEKPKSVVQQLTGGGNFNRNAVNSPEVAVKQKSKVNPFGDAKPREVLLEEKGLDWKKIDLELDHRRVHRPETEEETKLKKEIELLKQEMLEKSGDEQMKTSDLILQREKELEHLVFQLDDKIRYSQKNFERQGSGAGRGDGFNERPPSRPQVHEASAGFHDRRAYEEPRSGHPERPHSRPGTYENTRARGGAYEDPRPGFGERPRSRQGAYEEHRGSFPQRSFTSGSGAYQDHRASGFNERSNSRGTANSWARTNDGRKAIQGGGGFFPSRDNDRIIIPLPPKLLDSRHSHFIVPIELFKTYVTC